MKRATREQVIKMLKECYDYLDSIADTKPQDLNDYLFNSLEQVQSKIEKLLGEEVND